MSESFLQTRPALLVVDDDARIRELVEFAAHRSGLFGVIEQATDGEDALSLLQHPSGDGRRHSMPDIILTDLSMSPIDGFEFIEQLKLNLFTKDIPVVMFSSSGLPDDRERAIAASCLAFFEKPANLSGIESMLHSISTLWKHA